MARVFISHSSADKEAASSLIAWLKEHGFEEIFLDFDRHHGIPPGEDWERTLYSEVQRATAVVLLLTKNWFESKWCFAEFTQARALGKSVLPVVVTLDGNQFIGDNLQKINLAKNREEGLSRLLDRLRNISLEGPAGFALPRGRAPYPGLLSFDTDDAAVFFGREVEVREIIEQLERLRRRGGAELFYVHGESGSGKSSLIKAGLWPQLGRRQEDWRMLSLFRPGPSPINELRVALRGGGAPSNLIGALFNDPTHDNAARLIDAIREHARAFHATLLIGIDQCEEVLTLPTDTERKRFFAILQCLLEPTLKTIAVATIRSTDLPRVDRELSIANEQRLIAPFPLDRIPEIVRKPARVIGMEVDDALVGAIIRDATSTDALPLVAFLMRRLYDRNSDSNRLSLKDYESLSDSKAGLRPLETCVRDSANAAIIRLSPSNEELSALREAFVPGLVRINEAGDFVRRPLPFSEVSAAVNRLINALIEERLLVRRDTGEIEVSHEALFRVWPLLNGWLEEEREFLLGKARIEAAYADWKESVPSRKPDALLTGLLLSRAEAWMIQHPHRFTRGETQLIVDSLLVRETSARIKRRTQNAVIYVSVSVSIVVVLLGSIAWRQRNEATRQKVIAIRQTTRAIDEETLANQRTVDAEKERASARHSLYVSIIGAAAAWIEQGKLLEANRALKVAPIEERHWEWGYLVAQSSSSLAVLRLSVGDVGCGEFSPDGKWIIAASWAQDDVSVWDAATGKKAFILHGSGACAAGFSPDSTKIVTISDKDANVWSASTGREIATIRGHTDSILAAAFSPDGSRVVTASIDKTSRVWDVTSGHELAMLSGHSGWVRSASFSPDGTRIVTCSDDNLACVWDSANGRQLVSLIGHQDVVRSAEFSPDGMRIVTASYDKKAYVWDAATGRRIASLDGHTDRVQSAEFSSDGRRIVTASKDNTARVWDAITGKQVVVLNGHNGGVRSAVFNPDGSRIVTASSDGTARLWDSVTGYEVAVLSGHQGDVLSARFSFDGTRIVTAAWDQTVREWDADAGREMAVLRAGGDAALSFASFSADSAKIVTGFKGVGARVLDANSGREIVALKTRVDVRSASFNRSGSRVLTVLEDGTALLWDSGKGIVLMQLDGGRKDTIVAKFSPAGNLIVTISRIGIARMLDATTGKDVALLKGHANVVECATFSPDGKRLVTASDDGTASVWDALTGHENVILHGHTNEVLSALFSPDGSQIVTASSDRTARVWNATSGRESARCQGHDDTVLSAAFSPDGGRIVTASCDQTARVWDARNGREIATLFGHTDRVSSAEFMSDGTRILTASGDGTARVWDPSMASNGALAVLRLDPLSTEQIFASASVSPDGTMIVTANPRGVRIWKSRPATERQSATTLPGVPRLSIVPLY